MNVNNGLNHVELKVTVGLIEVPIGPLDNSYRPRQVSVNSLSAEQSAALRMLRMTLGAAGVRCQKNRHRASGHPDGALVDTNADAIRYLLDQVYVAMKEQRSN